MLCQNIGGNRISASGVSPKWVKSKIRKKRGERAKVNDYNEQYLSPEPKLPEP